MVLYKIQWKQSAKKELKKFEKKIILKVLNAVEELSKNPYLPGIKKIIDSEQTYRLRIGEYRIIY